MPATQHFCPLRNIFARYATFLPVFPIFGPESLFYRRFARFLRQICGWTTPVGLPCCYDNSCHQPEILPPGGALARFHRSHCVEPHTKVRWRAVARRSSQLKPYLPAGAPIPSRWAGAIFPSIFGQAGRVLAALYVPKFTVSELGVKKC